MPGMWSSSAMDITIYMGTRKDCWFQVSEVSETQPILSRTIQPARPRRSPGDQGEKTSGIIQAQTSLDDPSPDVEGK